MDSIISTFHIDWKIIIAQLINFGIVIAVLYFFAMKPLMKLMKERSEKISKGIDDAKLSELLIGKTRAEYDEIITKARNEAHLVFQNSKKEAQIKENEILEKARTEVTVMIENGKKTLEAEKVKMVADAKKEIVSLSVKIAEKIIDKNIGSDFNEKTIKELENL